MPQDLFKWEEGGVLKHHCPICQTPLSHEKCRTICLGNHVEWCHRYHSLFRKNWSSRCSACKNTEEQHEKRHREIAEILCRIKKFKTEEEAAAMELLMSPTTPKTPRTPLTARALKSVGGIMSTMNETPKASKKERKAAKKAAKALDRDKVVTTADIDFVKQTLHPEPEKDEKAACEEIATVEEDLEIKMNLKFVNRTWTTKSDRHDYIIKERGGTLEVDDRDINRLLAIFEVDSNAVGNEGELVKEVVEAIKSDLVHFHDELKMTARNKAGFWRWANKKAYRGLVENGKEWDSPGSNESSHKRKDRSQSTASGMTEERHDSATPLEPETEDDTSTSRSSSIDASSSADSAGTSFTVLSTGSSGSRSKATSTKKTPVLTLSIPGSKPETDPDGWTQVSKKVLKPATGKITLAGNGGLSHFAQKPKGQCGALSWASVARDD